MAQLIEGRMEDSISVRINETTQQIVVEIGRDLVDLTLDLETALELAEELRLKAADLEGIGRD